MSNVTHQAVTKPPARFDWSKATIHEYHDANGVLLAQVGRIGSGDAKQFNQRRPDGKGGWLPGVVGVPFLNYLLKSLERCIVALVVEGEKAADALNDELRRQGLFPQYTATTNWGGADKWHHDLNAAFAGKRVYVLPDNDKRGDSHARKVLASLDAEPPETRAAFIARLDLPGLPEKGDVADWLEGENLLAELLEMVDAAPSWAPEAEISDVLPVELFTFADMGRLPHPNWLIQGLLVQRTASVLSADSGSFKSFFALDMALSVATGRAFHGREVKGGTVIYIAAEGFYTLRDRGTAWARFHGVELPSNFYAMRVPVNMADARTVATFAAQVKGLKPALIVLDTLSQNALGLNENSNDEMARFVSGMIRLGHELEAHVQVVHHNSKAGGVRGASAIHNNVDAHISLERPEGDTINTVFVRCEKQRGAPFEPFALRGNTITLPYSDEYGTPVTSLAFELAGEAPAKVGDGRNARKTASEARLIELLRELRGKATEGAKVTKELWKDEAIARGLSTRTSFYRTAKELEERGAWYWWNGDCRVDEEEKVREGESSGESQKSQKSQNTNWNFGDSTLPLSPNSPKSPTLKGDGTFGTEMDSEHEEGATAGGEAPGLVEAPKAPKKRTAKRRATAEAEPYGAPSDVAASPELRELLARSMS